MSHDLTIRLTPTRQQEDELRRALLTESDVDLHARLVALVSTLTHDDVLDVLYDYDSLMGWQDERCPCCDLDVVRHGLEHRDRFWHARCLANHLHDSQVAP